MVSTEALQKQARVLIWLITIPFAALALMAVYLVGNLAWRGGQNADMVVIYYLPMFLYIWAIWMVRQALRAIAAGQMFSRVVPKLLGRVGLALFLGAVFKEVGAPLLTWLAWGHPYIRTFEASGVTLGIVGASLILLAQLLHRASSLREELDGFV